MSADIQTLERISRGRHSRHGKARWKPEGRRRTQLKFNHCRFLKCIIRDSEGPADNSLADRRHKMSENASTEPNAWNTSKIGAGNVSYALRIMVL